LHDARRTTNHERFPSSLPSRGQHDLQGATRHGENSGQLRSLSLAQAFDLSLWQLVQGFGIFEVSVKAGVMNRKVWLRTITSPIVCSIAGMWQATHSLPVDPAR